MEEKDKPIILSNENKRTVVHEVDEQLIKSAHTGEGTIEIKSMEQLMELAKMAKETHDHFKNDIKKIITKEKAEFVRKIRVEGGYSWRAVASTCHDAWKEATWNPPSNQLAGMAICELSAEFFGEHHEDENWN